MDGWTGVIHFCNHTDVFSRNSRLLHLPSNLLFVTTHGDEQKLPIVEWGSLLVKRGGVDESIAQI